MAQRDSIKGHWLSKSGVRRGIRDTVLAVPLVSDAFRKHWHFLSRVGACRGIFPTRHDAELAAASLGPVGYNDNLAFGPEIKGDPSDMRKRDYPVLFWLSKALAEGCKILNLGGSAGTEYFTYRQFLQFPERVIWMVCELPHVVEFGSSLANAVDAADLRSRQGLKMAQAPTSFSAVARCTTSSRTWRRASGGCSHYRPECWSTEYLSMKAKHSSPFRAH